MDTAKDFKPGEPMDYRMDFLDDAVDIYQVKSHMDAVNGSLLP